MNPVAQKSCSVCSKPVVDNFKPFCSARCADVDLGRWMGETYRVETTQSPEDEEAPDDNPVG